MLCLRVRVPVNFGIEIVAAELAALADLTKCVLETEIDRMTLDVHPGATAADITEAYRAQRYRVERWAIEAKQKKGHLP